MNRYGKRYFNLFIKPFKCFTLHFKVKLYEVWDENYIDNVCCFSF